MKKIILCTVLVSITMLSTSCTNSCVERLVEEEGMTYEQAKETCEEGRDATIRR